jgi:glycosyltransferase involved in cell wall biosynthesis
MQTFSPADGPVSTPESIFCVATSISSLKEPVLPCTLRGSEITLMTISVVIPTKNERRMLSRLLDSLHSQTMRPDEVVVADAGSRDGTVEIAEAAGCRVVEGGLPARGRNSGAQASSSNYVVFLDSDTFCPPNFIQELTKAVETRGLESGTVFNKPIYAPGDKGENSAAIRVLDALIWSIHNIGLIVTKAAGFPIATGTCMFCSRAVFERTGGFDESLTIFEDSDFARRAYREGRYGVLRQPVILISTRRFDQEGRIIFPLMIVVRGFFARLVRGEERTIEYFD